MATSRNATATATPPPRGTGAALTRRWFGLVDVAEADRDADDERREDERQQGRDEEGRDQDRQDRRRTSRSASSGCWRSLRQAGVRRGSGPVLRQAGDREAATQLADLGADPRRGRRRRRGRGSRPRSAGRSCASRPGPCPRVVVAGVPIRIPDAMLGGFWSNGMAFLLTVMPTSSRSASASRPVTPSGVTSTSARWLSVPPRDEAGAGRGERLGEDARVLDRAGLVRAEVLGLGEVERHGLGRDDVHQRAALDAGEDALVDRRPRACSCRAPGSRPGRCPRAGPPGRRRGRRGARAGSCAWWWSRCPRAGTGSGGGRPPRGRRSGPCPRTAARRRRGRWPPAARSPRCAGRRTRRRRAAFGRTSFACASMAS